ncbi:hypothetical protein [Chryseolinea sp. H1M3-3]|uniref:hypothetical protein n=1 Tax=Chryseolinea sp. H1M3-3 TaxID=3034144 RepID=UPI0023EDB374|nr:hypothetical protein [Chryseolinea sp. H1M3-3]
MAISVVSWSAIGRSITDLFFPPASVATLVNDDLQPARLERIQRAHLYAKEKLRDPVASQYYAVIAKRLRYNHAFTAAVRDYLTHPSIEHVITGRYSGKRGDQIIIESVDYLKIEKVQVMMVHSNGKLIEHGSAIRHKGSTRWRYICTVENPIVDDTRVKVMVIDRPGNMTMKEVIVRCSEENLNIEYRTPNKE